MEKWLGAALDYVPQWMEFQMRAMEQPGCVIAIAERGKVVFEAAYGAADLGKGIALTPRHRFRVASHSKSFTAAGIMKLREAGRLSLDEYLDAQVQRAVNHLRGRVSGERLQMLKEVLREQVVQSPGFRELLERAGVHLPASVGA